jgi:hypothetical protein
MVGSDVTTIKYVLEVNSSINAVKVELPARRALKWE